MTKLLTLFSTVLFLAITFESNAQRVVVETDKGEVCICDSREESCCDDGIVLFDDDEYVVKVNDKEVKASGIRVKINKASARSGSAAERDASADVYIEVSAGPGKDGSFTSDESAANRGAQEKAQVNKNAEHSKMGAGGETPAMRAPLSNICFTNKKTKETVCLATIVKIHKCCWK